MFKIIFACLNILSIIENVYKRKDWGKGNVTVNQHALIIEMLLFHYKFSITVELCNPQWISDQIKKGK